MPDSVPASSEPRHAAFGWRGRVRYLLADLLVFDRKRLGWRLATRTLIGLLLPFAAAHLLDQPLLVWVGIGAYLLAIGDSTDDGDRLQSLRLAIGALLGGLALATGVLAGGNLLFAVLGMLFWGTLAGLMGVYGNAFATMGLPVAWAYVELGLPGTDHSPASAATYGGLFAAGGALTLLLTRLVAIGGPYGPLKAQAAACFRAVATYLRSDGEMTASRDLVSPETRVRATIAEARRVAGHLRRGQQGTSPGGQQLLVLIELADRLFSLAALLREETTQSSGRSAASATLAPAAGAVADALTGPVKTKLLQEMLAQLEGLSVADHDAAQAADAATPDPTAIRRRMARELTYALRLVLGDAVAPAPSPPSVASPPSGLSQALAPLAACLDRNSVVARHALRFAVVTAVAVAAFWVFPPPFGYWIPLTVTVVLKPYAGMTLARTVQRSVGTAAGILLGMALMPLLATPAAQLVAVAVAFFCMMATLPFNYSLAIFFLSLGLIPFEHLLTPDLHQEVGLLRLAGTAIGATLAIVGGHLLWPAFERNALPALLASSLRSMAGHADRVLSAAASGAIDAEAIEVGRRQAGLDITNLQAAIQHAVSELGGNPIRIEAAVGAATALQRLLVSLNAVANVAPAVSAGGNAIAPFRDTLVATLLRLAAGERPPAWPTPLVPASPATDAVAAFLEQELHRMAAQLAMLCNSIERGGATT